MEPQKQGGNEAGDLYLDADLLARADDQVSEYNLRQYEQTGNTLFLAEDFMLSVLRRRTPAPHVLKWLCDGLAAWYEQEGDGELEKLLGLKRRPGQTTVFKDADIRRRNSRLMRDMDILMHLGCSREDAALVATDRPLHPWELREGLPAAETLASMHARRKDKPAAERLARMVGTPERRVAFLKRFGLTYMTRALKSML